MNEFGKVYMSTVGCGIVYGMLSDGTEPVTETTTAKQTDPGILWGDADCNKTVNISDCVLLARYLAEDKEIKVSAEGVRNAKVMGAATLTVDDLNKILQYLANLITQEQLAP